MATNFYTCSHTIDFDPPVTYYGWYVSTSGDVMDACCFPSVEARDAFKATVARLLGEEAMAELQLGFPGSLLAWELEKYCALLLLDFDGEDVSILLENSPFAEAAADCDKLFEEYDGEWSNVISDISDAYQIGMEHIRQEEPENGPR